MMKGLRKAQKGKANMLQVQKEFVNYSRKENMLIGNIKCISI